LDHVAGLIGNRGQVAGTVVAVDGGCVIRIGGGGEALAGIVLEMRLVAVGIGLGDAVAGVVVGIGEVALNARDGDEAVVGVVGVSG